MFKVGDTVTVHKPENTAELPVWNKQMDYLDGKTIVIKEVRDYTEDCFVFNGVHWFNAKWCKQPKGDELITIEDDGTYTLLSEEDRKEIIGLIVKASKKEDNGIELGKIAEIVLTKEERKELIKQLIGNLAYIMEEAILKKEAE